MRRCKILTALTLVGSMLALLLLEVHLQTAMAQTAPGEVEDEPTCSLDPTAAGDDCATAATSASDDAPPKTNDGRDGGIEIGARLRDLTRRVVTLTDESFDELTRTSAPATWLVMFKTDACAICKKAGPVLETLSMDAVIVDRNDRELESIAHGGYDDGQAKQKFPRAEDEEEEEDRTPKGPIYAYEAPKTEAVEGETMPNGPVYFATIDAGWSGRDTTRRFGVGATPTIILVRNEGRDARSPDDVDPRSYYVYRGQRAAYPLRGFALGGYAARRRMDMPPPLAASERKPRGRWGRLYETFVSPSARWAGGIVGRILVVWFAFTGVLGLFMRVHNYAWGEGADDVDDWAAEIERERARGREDHYRDERSRAGAGEGEGGGAEERSARRQKAMWEQKMRNRAKFAANREARRRKKEEQKANEGGGEDDCDDEFEGVGFSVKRSEVRKGLNDVNEAAKSKGN